MEIMITHHYCYDLDTEIFQDHFNKHWDVISVKQTIKEMRKIKNA